MKPETPASASWTMRDLADVAGDDDEREAHDRREERRDQRLPEVVGQYDQRDDRGGRREQRRLPEPARPRRQRQPLLDELAAARQARAADEHGDDHQPEDEERLHAGHRDAVVGREPAEGLEVVEDVLEHPDREPTVVGDPERREAREQRSGQRGHDLERQRGRVELRDRCGEDTEPARDDGREHGVHEGKLIRGETDEHRRRPRSPMPRASRGRSGCSRKKSERASVATRTIPGRMKRSIGTIDAEDLDGVLAGGRRLRLRSRSRTRASTAACATSSTPSEAASFASGDAVRSGRKADELDQHAERDEDDERDDERGRRRGVPAVDAGLERPVGIAADHRDRAGGEVDDPRAAVGQDDAEGDARR